MSPTATTSLSQRHAALSSPQNQIELLESLNLDRLPEQGDFAATINTSGWSKLTPSKLEIFQINIGKV